MGDEKEDAERSTTTSPSRDAVSHDDDGARSAREARSLEGELARSIVVIFALLTGLVALLVGVISLTSAHFELERRARFIGRALANVELAAAAGLEDRALIEHQLGSLLSLDEELVDVVVLRGDGTPITGIGPSGPLGARVDDVMARRPSPMNVVHEAPLSARAGAAVSGDDLFDAVAEETGEEPPRHERAPSSPPRARITLSTYPRFRDTLLSLFLTSMLLCLGTLFVLRGLARRAFRSLEPAFDAARRMSAGDFTSSERSEFRELAVLFDAFAEIARSLSRMLEDTRHLGVAVGEVVTRIRSETEHLLADAARQETSGGVAERAFSTMNASARETEATLRALITHVDRSSIETSSIRVAMDTSATALKSLLTEIAHQTRSVKALSAHADRFARSADALDLRATSAMESAARVKGALDDIDKRVTDAAALSATALAGTTTGSTAVEAAMARVHQLAEVVESLGANVRGLIARVEAVTPVVDAIVDVTSQTELLALNAGILAAQAGEHGRGFQVVVDELKALARRTSSLTGTVEDTVRSVLDERGRTAEATERLRAIVASSLIETGRATSSLATIRESSLAAQDVSSSLAEIVRARVRDADHAIGDLRALASVGATVGDTAKDLVTEATVLAELSRRIEETTTGVEDTARTQSLVTRRVSDALQDVARLVGALSDRQMAERIDAERVQAAMVEIRDATASARRRADAFAEVVSRLEHETDGLKEALARFHTVRSP